MERRALGARPLCDECLDDFRVDDGAALRNGAHGADELLDVVDALLQQVRAPLAPALEERQRVARVGVLAQHDDADPRMRLAQDVGCADALVGPGRRHPDVGDDDVGLLVLDGGEQRVEVLARRDDLDLRLRVEQAAHPFAHEVVVVGEHHAKRHRRSLGRWTR